MGTDNNKEMTTVHVQLEGQRKLMRGAKPMTNAVIREYRAWKVNSSNSSVAEVCI